MSRYAENDLKFDLILHNGIIVTMNPAFEESAMFENMIDLMFDDEYEVYVFDTAPTANARRLLGMSDVYSMWVNKMVQSREEAMSLKDLLSYSKKKKEKDPLAPNPTSGLRPSPQHLFARDRETAEVPNQPRRFG